MDKIKISAVSYTNTQPFIYGLRHTDIIDQIDLSLDIPADCAQKLIDGKVDIGLIPVAAVINMPYWEIVSDYCIGADGPVNSVFIFSNCEISKAQTLQLDPQSRSSNNLARVLLKNYWQTNPKLVTDATDYGTSEDPWTAFVQIGDRTFGKKGKYAYSYDLAEVWKELTGLPFVFAAWIANKPIPKTFMNRFNHSLKHGLDNRAAVIEALPVHSDFDLTDYLMRKLDFNLSPDKVKALNLFIDYIKRLD